MKYKVVLFILVVIIAIVGLYRYAYQDHRDISTEKSDFQLTTQELGQEFLTNDSLANHKYADKTVEIVGKITAMDSSSLTVMLDEKLSAILLDSVMPKLRLEDSITIKGRFVGYDDLLEEFKVDQVTIIP